MQHLHKNRGRGLAIVGQKSLHHWSSILERGQGLQDFRSSRTIHHGIVFANFFHHGNTIMRLANCAMSCSCVTITIVNPLSFKS